jgi:hypothetical protein
MLAIIYITVLVCVAAMFSLVKIKPKATSVEFSHCLTQILLNPNLLYKNNSIPDYPFFGELLSELIEYSRKGGGNITKQIKELKEIVLEDFERTKELKKINLESILQFSVIILLTWAMIWFTEGLEITKVSNWIKVLIFFIQAIGLICYFPVKRFLQKKYLQFWQTFLKSLYIFHFSLEAKQPLSLILRKSDIQCILERDKKSAYSQKCSLIIEQFRKHGGDIAYEIGILKDEIWREYRFSLRNLNEKVKLVRLCVIFVFLLPSYFIYLFSLILSMINL